MYLQCSQKKNRFIEQDNDPAFNGRGDFGFCESNRINELAES